MMGSDHDEWSKPVHRVFFAAPFHLGRTEVTFQEWDACVVDGGCNGYRPADQGWGREARPVINVSWHDTWGYVAWLSGQVSGTCRLPSEAEWEYAPRAGTTAEYALAAPDGSDDFKGKGLANCLDCGSEWDGKKTAPAGQFPSNSWGLQDMHGNIFEWVEDCLHADYQGGPDDGMPWLEANGDECGSRVLRGGSFAHNQDYARSAYRDWYDPLSRNILLGFRVVCSSPSSRTDPSDAGSPPRYRRHSGRR